MGYCITYESNVIKKTKKVRKQLPKMKHIILVLMAAMLLTFVFNSKFRRFFLPGDAVVTDAALFDLIENLKKGESFYDAATVFCREILDNA